MRYYEDFMRNFFTKHVQNILAELSVQLMIAVLFIHGIWTELWYCTNLSIFVILYKETKVPLRLITDDFTG